MLVHLPHCLIVLNYFYNEVCNLHKKVKTLVSSTCLLVPLVLAFHIDNVILVAVTLQKNCNLNIQDLTCDLYANCLIRGPELGPNLELGLLIIHITVFKQPQFEPIRTDEA